MAKRLLEVVPAAVPARSGNLHLATIETALGRLSELHSAYSPGNDTSPAMSAVATSMQNAINELIDLHGADPALMAKRRHIGSQHTSFCHQANVIGMYARAMSSDQEGYPTLRKKLLRAVEQLRHGAQRYSEYVDSRENMRADLAGIETYAAEAIVLDLRMRSAVNSLRAACDVLTSILNMPAEPIAVTQTASAPAFSLRRQQVYDALLNWESSLLCLGSSSGAEALTLRRPVLAKLKALTTEFTSPLGPIPDVSGTSAAVRQIVSDVEALGRLPATPMGIPFRELAQLMPVIRAQADAIITLLQDSPQAAPRRLIPVANNKQAAGPLIAGAAWG